MNDPGTIGFIRQHSELFWYIPEDKKEDISEEVLLETILNYGDIDAVKNLLKLWGIEITAKRFDNIVKGSDRKRGNLHEITYNFFNEFFNRHAH